MANRYIDIFKDSASKSNHYKHKFIVAIIALYSIIAYTLVIINRSIGVYGLIRETYCYKYLKYLHTIASNLDFVSNLLHGIFIMIVIIFVFQTCDDESSLLPPNS